MQSLPLPAHSVGCEWFTVFNDQGSTSDTWIHLAIPSLLDRDSFSAIPYVLFHECVCHGFQNLGPGFKPRRAPSPADSFSEGWMDVVCLEILEAIVAGNILRNAELSATIAFDKKCCK